MKKEEKGKELKERIKKSIQQSKEGKVKSRGSYSKFVAKKT